MDLYSIECLAALLFLNLGKCQAVTKYNGNDGEDVHDASDTSSSLTTDHDQCWIEYMEDNRSLMAFQSSCEYLSQNGPYLHEWKGIS